MARKSPSKGSSPKTTTSHRSAKTGKFVTPGYAKKHPSTTVKERNKRK
jgi:hypothetical protein